MSQRSENTVVCPGLELVESNLAIREKGKALEVLIMMRRRLLLMSTLVMWLGVVSLATAEPRDKALRIPDFTQGDSIPVNAKHDWNLGPTGLRGWMFCDELVTTDARQIAITAVDRGSPADGLIAVGDVVVGVGGRPFSFDRGRSGDGRSRRRKRKPAEGNSS